MSELPRQRQNTGQNQHGLEAVIAYRPQSGLQYLARE